MATFALADPQILINNNAVFIIPGSGSYTEGKGEQKTRTQSAGAGVTELVIATDMTTAMSKFKASLTTTHDNIASALFWKSNIGLNVITIIDGPDFTRGMTSATLITDYEINMGADGKIDIEFHCDPASA